MNSLNLNGTINGSSTLNFIVANIGVSTLRGTGTFALTGGGNLRLNAALSFPNATDDLKITSGALLDLNGKVFTNSGKIEILDPSDFKNIAGTFINGSATAYLLYTRQANFPPLVTLTATAAGNTVEYGAAAAGPFTMDAQESYSNLIFTGNASTKTANVATVTIAGNILINSGAIFNGNNKLITLKGNWTNSGGTFTPGTGTITFSGLAGQTITNTTGETFNNVTINTPGQIVSTTAGTNAITISKNIILTAGTFTAPLNLNIGGNWTNNGGIFGAGTNTVNFNGASAEIINGTAAAQTFNNVVVNLSGGFGLTVAGATTTLNTNNLTLTAGNFTAPATLNINGSSTATLTLNAGTFTAGTTVNITGNWTNNGGAFTPGANTVKFVGTASQQINGTAAAQIFNNVVVNLTAGQTLSTGGSTATLTTANLTETTGNFTAPATLNISNTLASLLTLTSGTFTAGANINIDGNWTNNGGTFIPGANTVNFIGTANQVINGTAVAQTFNNIVVNLTAGKILSSGGSTVSITTNNVTITTGSFTGPATLNITASAAATLTLNLAGTFTAGLVTNITGNWTNNGGTFTPGVNTVKFVGTLAQQINGTVAAQAFYNVVVSLTAGQILSCGGSTVALTTNNLNITSGNFTAPATLNINKTAAASVLTLTGGIFNAGAIINITGNWTNNGGSFIPGANTVNFTGTGAQAINGTAVTQTFFNIVLLKTAGQTLTVAASTVSLTTNNLTLTTGNFTAPATLNINSTASAALTLNAGTFTAGANVNITGNWTNNGGVFTPGLNTVNFVGTAAQLITGTAVAQTFFNIVVNLTPGQLLTTGGSTVTLTSNNFTMTTGNFNCPATLNINSTATATLTLTTGIFTAGTTINIRGNWTNNGGTFSPGLNTVFFKGTAGQIINGSAASQTFFNVVVNLTAGQTLSTGGSTVTVTTNNLTETTGNFTAPATLNINSTPTATITLTAGTFTAGANVNITGNWTNNGGAFTPGVNTVNFVGTAAQIINGTAAAQTFNNVVVNLTAGQTLSTGGSTVTLNTNNLTGTAGNFTAPATLNLNRTATASLTLTGGTLTAGTTMTIKGDWTHSGGVFTPGLNTVTFNGTATQTITDPSAETFYKLTSNCTGPIVFAASTSVIVTNTLTMTLGSYNVPFGQSLTLGNAAAATLVHTAGNFFGPGTFKRFIPSATAISSTVAPLLGLFPVGTAGSYRPIELNALVAVAPTTGGYVSVTHADPGTFTEIGAPGTSDGKGILIQRFYDATSTISTSGIVGGTYSLNMTMTGLSLVGLTTNIYLEANISGTPTGEGTTALTGGTIGAPVGKRTGLSLANLAFSFIICTNNEATTPIQGLCFSRVVAGNWSTLGTWSRTSGGGSCACVPGVKDSVIIQSGHTITLDVSPSINALYIKDGGALTIIAAAKALTIGSNGTLGGLTIDGSGAYTSTAAATLPQQLNGFYLNGSIVSGNSGTYSVTQDLVTNFNSSTRGTTVLNFTGTGNLNMGGTTFTNNGILNIGASSNLKNGTFKNAATGTLNDNANASFPAATALDASAIGNTVSFGANSAGTYTMPALNSFYNLIVGKTGSAIAVTYALKDLANPLAIAGDLTINSNTALNAATNNVDLTVSGNWTDNAGTFTPGTQTVTFNSALSQTITKGAGETFYNLSFTGASAKNLGGPITASGDLSIAAGTDLDVTPANFGVTVGGNWLDNGSFNAQLGTVSFNKIGAQTITNATGETFNILSLLGGGTKTLGGPVTLKSDLTIAAGTTLDVGISGNAIQIAGNWTNSGVFNPRSGTVTFNGTSAQAIMNASGETFNYLVLSGSGATILAGGISAAADLTISTSSSLDVTTSNYAVNVGGGLANNGLFSTHAGTVTFNGSAAQTIGGSTLTDFYNITLNNAAGVSLIGPENLNGSLTLTSGTFTTTGQIFTLVSNAAYTANIATIPASGLFAGNITMQRYVQPGNTDWYFLGAPITASGGLTLANWNTYFAMSGFPGSTAPSFGFMSEYTYSESALGYKDSGYVAATDISNAVIPGQGWECYVGPVPITISVSGPPVQGNFSFPVTHTTSGGIFNDGWNLISNPYPSTIDWNAGGTAWTKTNIAGAIYIWNPALSVYSSYVGGIGTNGGSNLLPSSQAFWIQTTGVPVLTIRETAKSTTNQVFFRTRPGLNENTLKLTITGNNYQDETAIHFSDSATIHYDLAYDAAKMYSLNPAVPSLASVADTFDLSINSIPSLTSGTVIPLRVLIGKGTSGTYTISRDSILTLSLSTCLILEDKMTGIVTDLRSTPSYTFNIEDTTTAPRFLLHIGEPIGKQTVAALCPGSGNGLAIAQGIGGTCSYTWKNVNDSVLQVDANVTGNDTLHNLKTGIYKVIITGNSGACGTLADTFAITSPASITAFTTTTNVSCTYNSDGGIKVDAVLGGSAPYLYHWSNGSANASQLGLPKGTYSLTITDAHACTQTALYIIANGSQLHGTFTQSADTVYLDAGAKVNFSNYSVGFSGFLWNFGDMSRDSSTLNPLHPYANVGVYFVTLIVTDGSCSDTVRHTVVVLPLTPLGIHTVQQSDQSVNVLSVNGDSFVDFNLSEETDVLISVYDMLGAKIGPDISTKVYRSRVPVSFGSMPAGIYLVAVNLNGKLISRKILH
jgi:hypothetical protein